MNAAKRKTARSSGYQGIEFSYAGMLKEIRQMKSLASEFLSSECEGVLDQCCETLENIRGSTTKHTHMFEVLERFPIRTIESLGEYRASGKNDGRSVYGTLSFRWEIQNPDRGKKRQEVFCLIGEATLSIQIFDTANDECVARWQIEAGDASSPGCHFHSAVNQYESKGLFPEWLKVPRLPSILLTPMDGVEFLLGELFQLRWRKCVSEDSCERDSWANSQKHRLQRILNWKLKTIREAATTPWMALKKAKPDLELLRD